ncbi:MAG: hypothetical protein ACQETD_04085 [Pseudomonadota bacterium]
MQDRVLINWLERVYYGLALLSLVNHIYVMAGSAGTEGWGALGWAMAARFSYFLSLGVGILGVLLGAYQRWRGHPVGILLLFTTLGAGGFLHLTLRQLLY